MDELTRERFAPKGRKLEADLAEMDAVVERQAVLLGLEPAELVRAEAARSAQSARMLAFQRKREQRLVAAMRRVTT